MTGKFMLRLSSYMAAALFVGLGAAEATPPIFENRTPVGFSIEDSTTTEDFIVSDKVTVRVDLNQEASEEYPVVGHFHPLEQSLQIGTTDTDGMQIDIAMVNVAPFGVNANQPDAGDTTLQITPVIHTAWIEESIYDIGPIYTVGATPSYEVMYARSYDGGDTFTTPVSVSSGVSYYLLTVTGTSFSTLDLEVESGGNPHVTFAFVSTADRERKRNVYYTRSADGGSTWDTPKIVNDHNTVGNIEGRRAAFPRMAIDDRDNIFISYVRGASRGTGTGDIMLAKVNRENFGIVEIGEAGTAGTGGVRLSDDAKRHTGPDLAVGDGDALHVIYFNDDDDAIEHKRSSTDTTWIDVSSTGWDQNVDGAAVGAFVDELANTAVEQEADFFFPSITVDRLMLPDRVFALYKFGDTGDEAINFNQYDDDGTTGVGITWGTASAVWNTGGTSLFDDGDATYNIELDWTITERVSAVVDDRLEERGDLHIAFTAGYSNTAGGPSEHDVFYARYNGTSWTLPEKVADDDSDGVGNTADGIAAADAFLLSPAIAQHPDFDSIFLAFAGGTDEGFGVKGVTDVNQHPYFKIIGRVIASEDDSVPIGGYEYNLSYTPTNPQTVASEVADNPVYIHVADPDDGSGLGADDNNDDGFLTGSWESVGSTLADDDKFFEGLINEDSNSTNEWGDDDDKIGLLLKLNVLGVDSTTNLQVVTNSTASDAGTGFGSRSVRVGSAPIVGLSTGAFFALGANIDIVPSNAAPTVTVLQPDGTGDTADTSFLIEYDLNDADDDLDAGMTAALYAYPSGNLSTVRDIRIFATLIADEQDVSANNVNGTDDLEEGSNRDYTWDDPSDALKSSLFASIFRVPSGSYFIYLVADDGNNPPVFAVSSGPLSIVHSPIIQQVDPIVADTVDSGVRTGLKANPYDLDFSVVDHDSDARVQLFYASVSGITSVSVTGSYPNQRFVLGKSVAGIRGIAITDSTTLTDLDREFSWDITDSVYVAGDSSIVDDGTYFLYAVATDSINVSVGNSATSLVVKHSPSFEFFEPAEDTQRNIDSGSQSAYTIQWQKGPGDDDYDDDASIDLYFTTDDPAIADHSTDAGATTDALINDADTKTIITGLAEDGDGASDMYVWNLETPPNNIPQSSAQVWVYAVAIGATDTTVARGGSITIAHAPFIQLNTRMPEINQGDVIRLEWDAYMVDDGSSTDDAYIRLYASTSSGLTTAQNLEGNLVGEGGADNTYIINSSDGTATGTITSIRETDEDAFSWDTKTSTFTLDQGTYAVYAAISSDATFVDNTRGRVSESSNLLSVKTGQGITPNMVVSPNELIASVGDTLTFEVLVQTDGIPATMVSAIMDFPANLDTISFSPFTDLGEVFSGGTVIEDTTIGNQLRYTRTGTAEIIGTVEDPARLASFQMVVSSPFNGISSISFDDTEAALSIVGRSAPLTQTTGMSAFDAEIQSAPRGRVFANVLLEGRAPPVGSGNHATRLDVHLRVPGSTIDINDAIFTAANDDVPGTADTVEVQTSSAGGLALLSVPQGRYVLTFKDSSHLSGRTDTLTIRNGETIVLTSANGLFASDIRGDASFLLSQDGKLLKAGDATGDNEIDEDDVNAIDAAWGTDNTKSGFARADLNNDERVGVEDLTVTTSNISNSTGFGAPPVFKRMGPGPQSVDAPALALSAPGFEGQWRSGSEIELLFTATGLRDLAGYSLELDYDPHEMSLVRPPTTNIEGGHIFAPNPNGYFEHLDIAPGRVAVAAARLGTDWTAAGDGEVMRLSIRLNKDGFPESLRVREGKLLSASYQATELNLAGDPVLLALPRDLAVRQNFPNPFNPTTTIPFEVPAVLSSATTAVPVSVEIFNTLGQLVRTLVREDLHPGYHRAIWDGRNAAGHGVGTGMYLYRVRAGELSKAGRMTLIK
jgi:hypothetical protein